MQQSMGGYWKSSVLVFKNVRAVVAAGMLLALHIILAMVLGIYLTPSVKFSVSFITNVVTGYLFGPWMALITGGLGDILQYVLKPVGEYFFGWTLNAAVGGLVYGLAFYRRAPKEGNPAGALAQGGVRKAGDKAKRAAYAPDFLSAGIFAAMLAGWFFLPFLDVTTKAGAGAEREVMNTGSAFLYLTGAAGESGSMGPKTLAGASLVLMLAGVVFALCRRRVLVILLGVAACLWLLLPVYEERSILAVRPGFVLLCAGFAAAALLNLCAVLRTKSIDAGFLLRCFLAMLFVAVVIQMFLGTIWCVLMYGKGFWFYFVLRAVKSLIQLPFNTILVYYVIRALKQLRIGELVR